MSKVSLTNFQNNISRKFSSISSKCGSRNKQTSIPTPVFLPNLDEMKRVFEKFDVNKDCKVSQEEYKALLKDLLGKKDVELEVSRAFEEADKDGDGFIDFKEFMDLHKRGGGIKSIDIQNAFRAFDLDGDGRISAEELLEVLKKLGEKCSLNVCRKMVRGVDADGDGLIDIEEFTKMMTNSLKLVI